MPTSYGGYSSASRGPVIFGVVAVIAAVNFVIYSWGDFKVSKMLEAYPDKPRTVQPSGAVTYTTHLKSQLAKAEQKITDLTAQIIPADRPTKAEKIEQWEQSKLHLHKHVRKLELQLKETAEKLHLVTKNAKHGERSEEDRAGVDAIIGGGES